MNIDIVIPYVSSADPNWWVEFSRTLIIERQKNINNPANQPAGISENRFRDFGTFKYLLRGIETCCPWINKIYVVLQQPSQKPKWLKEGDRLKVVYHNEIIPQEYLPTFNSATIELFVWRIPGLSENFIYINDDMFPLRPMSPESFFDENGTPRIHITPLPQQGLTAYGQMLKNSEWLALKAAGQDVNKYDGMKLKDTHTWTSMRLSTWKMFFDKYESYILASLSPFRNARNITQQLPTYYHWVTGQFASTVINGRMDSFLSVKPEEFADMIVNRRYDILCINDTGVGDYEQTQKILIDAFLRIFPFKSSFEI